MLKDGQKCGLNMPHMSAPLSLAATNFLGPAWSPLGRAFSALPRVCIKCPKVSNAPAGLMPVLCQLRFLTLKGSFKFEECKQRYKKTHKCFLLDSSLDASDHRRLKQVGLLKAANQDWPYKVGYGQDHSGYGGGVAGGDKWAKKREKWHRSTQYVQLLAQTTKYRYRTVI